VEAVKQDVPMEQTATTTTALTVLNLGSRDVLNGWVLLPQAGHQDVPTGAG
jgi:hypothetical protein